MTEKTAVETTDLIASAKALIIKPRETKDDKELVEASDPAIINELLAARQNIEDQLKPLTAKKAEIDAIIKDLIGKADVLTVHGAEVASISRWRETQLDADFIKEHFALADYPEMFKRVTKTRLNIKK